MKDKHLIVLGAFVVFATGIGLCAFEVYPAGGFTLAAGIAFLACALINLAD